MNPSTIVLLGSLPVIVMLLLALFKRPAGLWKWRNKLNIVDTMMLIQIGLLEKLIDMLDGILKKKKKNDRRGVILYAKRLMFAFAIAFSALYFNCPLAGSNANGTNIVNAFNSSYQLINTVIIWLSIIWFNIMLFLNMLDFLKVKEEFNTPCLFKGIKKHKGGGFGRVFCVIVHVILIILFYYYIWYVKDVVVSCNPEGHKILDFIKLIFGPIIGLFN